LTEEKPKEFLKRVRFDPDGGQTVHLVEEFHALEAVNMAKRQEAEAIFEEIEERHATKIFPTENNFIKISQLEWETLKKKFGVKI
jgi:hypothetical protein